MCGGPCDGRLAGFLLAMLFACSRPWPAKARDRRAWLRCFIVLLLLGQVAGGGTSLAASAPGAPELQAILLPLRTGPVWGLWKPPTLHECFLSEKWCRQWLSEHGDSRPKKDRPPDLFSQVDINKKLSPMTKEAIRAVFEEADVLSMRPGKLKDASFRLELRPDFEPKMARRRPSC